MLEAELLISDKFQDDLGDFLTSIPKPFPDKLHQKWDNEHVQMPFSKENEFVVQVNKRSSGILTMSSKLFKI